MRAEADPASVIPVLRELVDTDLEVADVRNYRSAAKHLRKLRTAMNAVDRASQFEDTLGSLREQHKRRPRFLEELRKAGL